MFLNALSTFSNVWSKCCTKRWKQRTTFGPVVLKPKHIVNTTNSALFTRKIILLVKILQKFNTNKTLGVFFCLSAVVQNLFHAFVYIILVMTCINVFVYYAFVQEVGTFNLFLGAFLLVFYFHFPESQFLFWVLHSLKFGPWTGLSATEWTKKLGPFINIIQATI